MHASRLAAANPPRSSVAPEAPPAPTRIYPYGPPQALAEGLWQVKGSLAIAAIPRNMTIYRLPDGRLLLYSVIAMHEDGMRELESLGEPSILVIPHDRHQMDAPFYKQRYARLRVLAPEPDRPRSVPVDAGLEELGALGLRAYPLPGASYHEVVLELPIPGGIALGACELLSNIRAPRGLWRLAFALLGPPGGGFGVARAVRWREVVNRRSVHEWLCGLAERDDIRMLLVGHGSPVIDGAGPALRHAARGA